MTKSRKSFVALFAVLTIIAGSWFVYSGKCLKWAIDHHSPKFLGVFLAAGAPVDADFGAYRSPLTHAVSTGGIEEIGIQGSSSIYDGEALVITNTPENQRIIQNVLGIIEETLRLREVEVNIEPIDPFKKADEK